MSLPANLRGWGPGWPTNRQSDMRLVQARVSGARWWVHKDIAPIVQWLVDEVERRGYLFDHGPEDTDDDWGYANRAIRGRNSPSNHSWGLAIDMDAQNFPMGQSGRRPPAWIIDLFEAYGFEWGGTWSRPDPMHFEFRGSITEARHIVAMLAASHLAGAQPTTPAMPPPAFALLTPLEEEPDMDWLVKIDDGRTHPADPNRPGNGIWYREHGVTYFIGAEAFNLIDGGHTLGKVPLMRVKNPSEDFMAQMRFR